MQIVQLRKCLDNEIALALIASQGWHMRDAAIFAIVVVNAANVSWKTSSTDEVTVPATGALG